MFETISLTEVRPGVHRVRLERRRKLNAITEPMIDELRAATDELASRDPAAIVVEGAGNRAFSIGMDTRAPIAQTDDPGKGESVSRKAQELMEAIATLPAPVVAAIQGRALGGGLELALTADVRIGGESSTYGFPEITHGLIPGAGATQRLPTVVGRGRAYEMMFTGRKYDAGKMADWGLLETVVPDDEVTETALDRAESLGPPDTESDDGADRGFDSESGGTSKGYMLEQSGLGRAFSRDPFDASAGE